jgi:lipoprotein-releasing system permease protein
VALRLLRARKINLISILGVMIGVGAIIVVMSVMDGFQKDLRAMIRGTLSDVLVQVNPELVTDPQALMADVEAIDGVTAVTIQRHTFAAIPVGGTIKNQQGGRQNWLPIQLIGIDPRTEGRVSKVLEQMTPALGHPENPFELDEEVLGEFLEEDTPRVAVSRWMARRLGLHVGRRFVIVSLDRHRDGGESFVMNDQEVIVSRLYKSGNRDFDRLHAYVDLTATGRAFFRSVEGTVAELRIKLDDYDRFGELKGSIIRAVGKHDPSLVLDDPDWYVETWEDRQASLLSAVENEKHLLAFVLFFIVLVGCFTIFATLTMTVVEKTRDIGILRALGATPGGILSIFLLNGVLVGTLGAALGYGAGMLVAHNVNPIRNFLRENFGWDIFPVDIYLFDEIPTYIDQPAAFAFALGAAISALVFAIIPAVRAARLRPVNALRYE